MKNRILVSAILLFVAAYSIAAPLKPIAQKISERKSAGAEFRSISLFEKSDADAGVWSEVVKAATLLKFNNAAASNLVNSAPEQIEFTIPIFGRGDIQLELFKVNITTPDFSVVASSNGLPVNYPGGVHYRGIVKGDNSSVASLSVFNDEVMGLISTPAEGNFVLGKMNDATDGLHVIYKEQDLKALSSLKCFTEENNEAHHFKSGGPGFASVNCIRIYWEVNYDIYLDKEA
jgi:hypothetical protein